MKVQVTAKQICQGKRIFTTGYCRLQTLFPGDTAKWFHAGIYGWNADYFQEGSILLVTGYSPQSATRGFTRGVVSLPREFVQSFEDKAQAIVRECEWTKPDEREIRMNSLRQEFWDALDNYMEEK